MRPFTLDERLRHIREAKRTKGTKIPWLCDTMDNDLKHALGNRPNSEFVIGPDLTIVRKRSWSDPGKLRKDLEELVGAVENPTKPGELDLKAAPPPKEAARGVVERVARPRSMKPVRLEPQRESGGQPFYAKLRAEAEPSLLRKGTGRLYLGFHLDPLYHVHWNNLVKPLRVELDPPPGMTVERATLEAPQPEEPADIDPREFLVDVKAGDTNEPLRLTVHYFACNDEQGWCKPVTQRYAVRLQADPDGGRVRVPRRRGGGRPRAGRRGGFGRITAVDTESRTLTVRMRGGQQRTLTVADDARLRREGDKAEFPALQKGDYCRFRLEDSEDGKKTIRALRARRRPPEFLRRRNRR